MDMFLVLLSSMVTEFEFRFVTGWVMNSGRVVSWLRDLVGVGDPPSLLPGVIDREGPLLFGGYACSGSEAFIAIF